MAKKARSSSSSRQPSNKKRRTTTTESNKNKKKRPATTRDTAPAENAGGINNTDLQEQRDSARSFICHVLKTTYSGGPQGDLWNRLSESWKRDREIAIAAASKGHVLFSDLPTCFKRDKTFFTSVIEKEPTRWHDLPESKKRDPVYARAIPKFDNDKFVSNVVAACPRMRIDWRFWLTVIRHTTQFYSMSSISRLLQALAPPSIFEDTELMREACKRDAGGIVKMVKPPAIDDFELWDTFYESPALLRWSAPVHRAPLRIRQNKDLMLKACIRDGRMFTIADSSLFTQEDFVKKLLLGSPHTLRYLPAHVQERFSDVVTWSLGSRDGPSMERLGQREIAINMIDTLWHSEDFVKSWFKAGGYYFHDRIPAKWRENKEAFMWLAQYGTSRSCRMSFDTEFPEDLRHDKEFLLRMIEKEPSIYWCIEDWGLKTDYDVALLASVSCEGLPSREQWKDLETWDDDFWEFFLLFCDRIQKRWAMGSAFPGAIIADYCDEATTRYKESHPFLSLWQEGEGSFTSLIRDFADMPCSPEEFGLLSRAVRNLPKQAVIDDYKDSFVPELDFLFQVDSDEDTDDDEDDDDDDDDGDLFL